MSSRVQPSIRTAETEQRNSVRADTAGHRTDTAGPLRAQLELRAQRARTNLSLGKTLRTLSGTSRGRSKENAGSRRVGTFLRTERSCRGRTVPGRVRAA